MVKVNSKSQNGRSMVEMLGVLSIIGVLSVGGISAYSTAMKKHKANELLHQASMLASTISAQAMTNDGNLPSTVTSFGNSSYGNFSTFVTDALDGKGFSITIENVDSGACTQLEKMAGGMVRDVDCDEATGDATITYYKNLATNDKEGKNSPTGEKPDPACVNVTCPDGLTCFHGQCKCPSGVLMCGDQCCEEGTYCTGNYGEPYTCITLTGGCTKNSDCKDAEGNVDATKYCKLSASFCTGPTSGTCTDKGTLTEYTLNLPSGDLTVYKGPSMNWWSAQNLCLSHGKQMVTMADLGIQDTGTKTSCYFDKATSDYVSKPCICSGGDSDCTQTAKAIYDNLGTSEKLSLADSSKSELCNSRILCLSYGGVCGSNRDPVASQRYNSISALCR